MCHRACLAGSVAADRFTLNTIRYTMMYHYTPFEQAAGATGSLTLAIQNGKYPTPDNRPEYSREVLDLVDSMLQLKSEDRPSIDQVRALSNMFHACWFGPNRTALLLCRRSSKKRVHSISLLEDVSVYGTL